MKIHMYKYCHHTGTQIITGDINISLHDCKTTQFLLEDKPLSFSFPDGFWISKKDNVNVKLFYTFDKDFPLNSFSM